MRVVESSDTDLGELLEVSRAAFGGEDVPALVSELLVDPSASTLSILRRSRGSPG